MVGIVDGIDEIHVKRDTFNRAATEAPRVGLHEMVKLKGDELEDTIIAHLPRLEVVWTAEQIDKIERDHSSLLVAH